MGPHHQWSQAHRKKINKHVFQRVAIYGNQSYRGRPLVVDLVNVLVDEAVVKESVNKNSVDNLANIML